MKKNKGFTLIELLVVIAIIGVLASVVLASLNAARNKGADSAIKANLANMRAAAEIYYDNAVPNSYGTETTTDTCTTSSGTVTVTAATLFADPVIKAQITGAVNANSGSTDAVCISSDGVTGTGGTASTTWALSVLLKAGTSWCVDSTGAAKTGTATYNSSTPFQAYCL